jgi:hypothetical protein
MSGHDGLREALRALLAHHDRQNGVHEGSPNDCAEGRAARAALRAADHPEPLDVERLAEVLNTGRYTGSMVAARAWAEDIGRRYAAYQERSRPEDET